MLSGINQTLTHFVITRRHPLALLAAGLFLVTLYFSQSVSFDASPEKYFNQHDPFLNQLYDNKTSFGSSESVIFMMTFKNATVFKQNSLLTLKAFSEKARLLPFSEQVDSLVDTAFPQLIDDTVVIAPLISEEHAGSTGLPDMANIRSQLLKNPIFSGRLVSTDEKSALIIVRVNLPRNAEVPASQEIKQTSYNLMDDFMQRHPEISLHLTGRSIHRASMHEKSLEDTRFIIPLMYICIFTLLGIFLRSFLAVFAIAIVTTMAAISALGIAVKLGIVLNVLSLSAGNIIVTVAIAHCVHLAHHYLQHLRHGRQEKFTCLKQSLEQNLLPISITSLTTMIGFLSMNFSSMPPAHDLGNITALGIFFAYLYSLMALPALLVILPISNQAYRQDYWINQGFEYLSGFIFNNYRCILLVFLFIIGSSMILVSTHKINDKFTENIKQPNRFRTDNQVINQQFGGFNNIEIVLESQNEHGFSNTNAFHITTTITETLRKTQGIQSVFSYSDEIKEIHKVMSDPTQDISFSNELLAQYLLLLEVSNENIQYYLTTDQQRTRILVKLSDMDSQSIINLHSQLKELLEKATGDISYSITGLSLMWAYLSTDVVSNSIQNALIALILISLVLIIFFRSLKMGVISLLPNLTPALLGYGLWALFETQIDLAQMMVLSLTIGIVVDDTIHLMASYIKASQSENNPKAIIQSMLKRSGIPVMITTLVLILGFSLLGFSEFIPNAHLGMLTALILACALVMDLLLLPAILIKIFKNNNDGNPS